MFRVTTIDPENPPRTEDGKVDYSQDFFGRQTNLTVSGQMEAEAMAMAFGNVYTFGPTFRAEHSYTTRHAAEFWMIEPEMAFADLQDDMQCIHDMLKFVIGYVLEHCPDEMQFCNNFYDKGLIELKGLLDAEFAHVTYTEAIELLTKAGDRFKYPVSWGCDLQTEHERYLTEEVYKKPVFVTDYPKDKEPSMPGRRTTARRSRQSTSWCPASARSSAAASVRNGPITLKRRSPTSG